ncbi:MAG: hypothetical protein JRE07_00300 [Deltaproteobacteria bacterium]|nr:hypothetical protein [Deltaproteobacteria bacterium]MBW1968771.1 hypothetical protein [Deltaproteobacteria bacterium]MBW2155838.1 hypothetical protein [Deltaproteobacteria bacterium]MBW2198904.1 hypothetical protein [Deltaproteobacteria bacterium]MBW2555338.1 hypothetical protein [Deltaproteobacteria bacterium]
MASTKNIVIAGSESRSAAAAGDQYQPRASSLDAGVLQEYRYSACFPLKAGLAEYILIQYG